MNCANHPETTATAFCRECGQPMCPECQRPALGSVYCATHLPAMATPAATAYTPPPPPASPYHSPLPIATPDNDVHPALALILGFLPGVGAIYNGQYAKGLTHAVVFGLLVTMVSNAHNDGLRAFLGIMIGIWVIYQAFEAFHTARQRRYGLSVEEFSSLFEGRQPHSRFPAGAVLLIGLGFILLLNTTDVIRWEQLERYWPLVLIAVGLYLLYVRLSVSDNAAQPVDREARR